MKKISFLFVLICLAALILPGCNKHSDLISSGSTLNGSVLLFDEGDEIISSEGVQVSIENSNPLVSAVTNASGNFAMPIGASLHSFCLVYSKPGIGTFKRYFTKDSSGGFMMTDLDGSTVSETSVSEALGSKSTVSVNSLQVAITGDSLIIKLNAATAGTTGRKFVRLIYEKDLPGISINTVDKKQTNWSHLFPVNAGDNRIVLCMKCSSLCAGWKSGDQVYFTAYGDAYYPNIYEDRESNSIILPNLNATRTINPVSVVVP